MRRLWAISAVICLSSCLLSGCNRRTKNPEEEAPPEVVVQPNVQIKPPQPKKKIEDKKPPAKVALDKGRQEKFDAALLSALTALADRKWHAALTAFETARGIQNTEFVQSEIARLKQRIEQEQAAKTTIKSIETVLNEGKADVALKLVTQALLEFGAGDDAPRLAQLRLQAEAMLDAQKKEDPAVRFQRLRKEGDAALAAKNLRAAALAYEQALLGHEDADLQKVYNDLRGKLETYDALRRKATELRRNPAQLDAAIDSLKGAKDIWDSEQIRQDLDEAMLARQNRRDTVSVADFEVRNDVGMPNGGEAVADALLPLLKRKFDPVERKKVQRALAELRPANGLLNDAEAQKQIGALAKVRYLVVGSIHRLAVVSVRARLVDVRTGLVVQTGKVLAPTMEEALNLVPDLAKQLMMTDQEKMQEPPNVAQLPKVVAANAPLPPAPPPPVAGKAQPPALIKANLVPPAPPALNGNLFARFAATPQLGFAANLAPPDVQFRMRLLQASVEMGDYLFLSGRFAEAQRQYQFALALDPNNTDLQMRWQRCLPLVPPAIPVGLSPTLFARPRLTVLTFGVGMNPLITPPQLSYWTPLNLAPYFSSRYDVVDPTEVAWFMARTGLSVNDLANNPFALRLLSQAVGVRYFVFGNHQQNFNGGFDASAYLVDGQFAYQVGAGQISVQDYFELKLRLPELAALTMMTPNERAVYAGQQVQFNNLLANGMQHMNQAAYDLAVADFTAAVNLRPTSVQAQYYLNQASQLAQQFALEIQVRRNQEAQAAAYTAVQQRQQQLAQKAQRAAATAAPQNDTERQANYRLRFQAQAALLKQAQAATKARRFDLAANLYQGALKSAPPASVPVPADVTIPPQQEIHKEFSQARLEAEKAEHARIAELSPTKAESARLMREEALIAKAQAKIAAEQKRTQDALAAAQSAQTARDEQAYAAGLKQGQLLLAQSKFDAALAAFQAAQAIKPTATAGQLIELTVQRQALALAKSEQARQALEKKFLDEHARRKAAEEQAKQNEDLYQRALQAAQKALADKNYALAKAKFQEAGRIHQTDEVLAGLKQVQVAQTAQPAPNKAQVQEWITAGLTALKAKNFDAAEKAFRSASLADPANPAVVQGLKEVAEARANAQASFKQALAAGQAELTNKKYADAVTAFKHALQINPNDTGAQQLLQQAQHALQGSEVQAHYQKAMKAGQRAMVARQYTSASQFFRAALKLVPDDPQAMQSLQQVEQAQANAKQQAVELAQKQAKYQALMKAGQAAMFSKNYASAIKDYSEALKLMPRDFQATRGWQLAQNALAASKLKTPMPGNEPAKTFEHAMQKASALEKEHKYAEAASAFQDALKFRPKDATAFAGYQRSQFAAHVSLGQQHLAAMMFVEAAREFEAALRISPNNPNVLRLLQKAKNRMK